MISMLDVTHWFGDGWPAVIGGWLVAYLVHSTLFLSAAWILVRRIHSPVLIDRIWKITIWSGLLTASVAVYWSAQDTRRATSVRADLRDPSIRPGDVILMNVAAELAPGAARSPVATKSVGAGRSPSLLFLGVALVWIVTSCVIGIRTLIDWRRFHRRLRTRTPLSDPALLAIASEVVQRLNLRLAPRFVESDRVAGPLVLPNGEICLPAASWRSLDPPELRAVIAHELTHLARGDHRLLMPSLMLDTLLAIQPLNRIGRMACRVNAESICDDMAIRACGDGLPLARCLLAYAAAHSEAPHYAATLRGIPRISLFVHRVRRLLKPAPTPPRGRSGAYLAAAFVCALGVITPFVRPTFAELRVKSPPLAHRPQVKVLDATGAAFFRTDESGPVPLRAGDLVIRETEDGVRFLVDGEPAPAYRYSALGGDAFRLFDPNRNHVADVYLTPNGLRLQSRRSVPFFSLGLRLQNAGTANQAGWLVVKVVIGSVADRIGLRAGDRLLDVADRGPGSFSDLRQVLLEASFARSIVLDIERGDERREFVIQRSTFGSTIDGVSLPPVGGNPADPRVGAAYDILFSAERRWLTIYEVLHGDRSNVALGDWPNQAVAALEREIDRLQEHLSALDATSEKTDNRPPNASVSDRIVRARLDLSAAAGRLDARLVYENF